MEYNYVIQGDRSPFYGITTLRDLVVGEHVTTVDDYCFHGCTGLASVSIGSHVATIGEYAFYGCTGLTSVSLPRERHHRQQLRVPRLGPHVGAF